MTSNMSEPAYDGSDFDNALIFYGIYHDLLRAIYTGNKADWAAYKDGRWQISTKGLINEYAKGVILELKRIKDEGSVDHDAILNVIDLLKKSARRKKMIADAATIPEFAMENTEFDRQPHLLNALNATIELSNGQVNARQHNPADYLTQMAPVTYDPTARSEKWSVLLRLMCDGDEEVSSFLQRAVG